MKSEQFDLFLVLIFLCLVMLLFVAVGTVFWLGGS
jgi:flagellar basal body-associated protein FliL